MKSRFLLAISIFSFFLTCKSQYYTDWPLPFYDTQQQWHVLNFCEEPPAIKRYYREKYVYFTDVHRGILSRKPCSPSLFPPNNFVVDTHIYSGLQRIKYKHDSSVSSPTFPYSYSWRHTFRKNDFYSIITPNRKSGRKRAALDYTGHYYAVFDSVYKLFTQKKELTIRTNSFPTIQDTSAFFPKADDKMIAAKNIDTGLFYVVYAEYEGQNALNYFALNNLHFYELKVEDRKLEPKKVQEYDLGNYSHEKLRYSIMNTALSGQELETWGDSLIYPLANRVYFLHKNSTDFRFWEIGKYMNKLLGESPLHYHVADMATSPGKDIIYFLVYSFHSMESRFSGLPTLGYIVQYHIPSASASLIGEGRYIDLELFPNRKIYLYTLDHRIDQIRYPDSLGMACKLHTNIYPDRLNDSSGFYIVKERYNHEVFNDDPTYPGFVHFQHSYSCDSAIFYFSGNQVFDQKEWFIEDIDHPENTYQPYSGDSIAFKVPQKGRFYIKCKGTIFEDYYGNQYHAWYSDTLYLNPPITKPNAKIDVQTDTLCAKIAFTAAAGFSSLMEKDPRFYWKVENEKRFDSVLQYTFESDGEKALYLYYSDGYCFDEDTAILNVYNLNAQECEKYNPVAYIPTAFSPNDDNLNDYFSITTKNVDAIDLKIFNAWGQLIFETQDPEFKWSGNSTGSESYIYTLRILNSNTGRYKDLEGIIYQLP